MGVLQNGDEDLIRVVVHDVVKDVMRERSMELRPNRSLVVAVLGIFVGILGAAALNLVVITRAWTQAEARDDALRHSVTLLTRDRWTASQAVAANGLQDHRIDANSRDQAKLEGSVEAMQGTLNALTIQMARLLDAVEIPRRSP